MKAILILSITISLCLVFLLFAEMSSEVIHVQVRLADDTPEQNPFEGKTTVVLRIFDAQHNGNLLWSTNLPDAVFYKGLFETALGSNSNPLAAIIFSQETSCYLEVEINGEIQNPRQIIRSTEISNDDSSEHTGAYLQSGAVAFFDLPQCPVGWIELTEARGRYIVGLNPSGVPGAVVGTALSDLENRPVGKHTHTITDPGHTHSGWHTFGCDISPTTLGEVNGCSWTVKAVSSSQTGISVLNEGITGTNSPYIQYILCALE